MSYTKPVLSALYRRKSDGLPVTVLGCTGSGWSDSVTLRRASGGGSWHVRVENFWKKYEIAEEADR